MSELNLDLNKVYIDAEGNYVTLIGQFAETDTEFKMGYLFVGDNTTKYRADGGVSGQLGDIKVDQHNAIPLVAEFVATDLNEGFGPFELDLGSTYLNGIDQLVRIVGFVPETSRFYKRGYRYVDDRGSFYLPNGVTDTGIWKGLNLVRHIPETEVSHEEFTRIEKNIVALVRRNSRAMRISDLFSKASTATKRFFIPAGIGALVGLGSAAALEG